MVSLRKSINDRANNYNHKYLNCYLETISRTISFFLIVIDILMIIYDRITYNNHLLIASHILSCILFFTSTFKPMKYSVLQFIVFSVGFLLFTFYKISIALALLVTDAYGSLLLSLSLHGFFAILDAYAIYISIIYYIRLKNAICCDETSFEDEIEEANVQLIIDDDDVSEEEEEE
ncbi:hypothetical protein BCR36DRAFT_361228 [Piromyces finnis]|uniref:Uncharacterized protein n=1 Tax=Piromyces finnis TaxID=1754191 RepID=A0A1Y1UY69_9FUNG|nr:hypothetical protein BCR36DRAFT_361228 [Piromyces finnis]|eukprot:ORX43225.1 hypothetical protein BCR36DRAFT_361228 [Piromyces finnis]